MKSGIVPKKMWKNLRDENHTIVDREEKRGYEFVKKAELMRFN